jgi:hypothetical protein
MSFDRNVPAPLKNTQQWFASIISRPIDENSQMNPISPSGALMELEAQKYIVPSPTLQPDKRIQIYNQQYWWRLITSMQETFPLVTRLFGYTDFNQMIAIPYLVKYAPNHWSLNKLGDRLFRWIQEEYTADDKLLILGAASIDWAYNDSFVAPSKAKVDLSQMSTPDDLSSLLVQPMQLQPYVHLFALPYNLFRFRTSFLMQEPEYWVENDFPELEEMPEGEYLYFVLYRNHLNNIDVVAIEKSEYRFLKRFETPTTIEAECTWLEQQDGSFCQEAGSKMQLWFQNWFMRQWLGLEQA